MRKFLIALAILMIVPAFTAKAEKDKKEEDKHKPVKLAIWEWEYAWPPVFRAAQFEEAINCVMPESERAMLKSECE